MFRKALITLLLLCTLLVYVKHSSAFEYAALPVDNLITNPWFRENCEYSDTGWETTPEAPWQLSDKTQDPTDENCNDEWMGFATRFARNVGQTPEFYPNTDALIWQVVGPVDPADRTLHFHFLFVAHRMNQFRARIYGSDSASGPWTTVWTPLDKQWLSSEGANGPYNQYCPVDRECLWDLVTEAELGSLDPLTTTIDQGYAYYKIEFLGNYPDPDETATGDVGGKLARVYFKVSEADPVPSPSPSPSPTPTPSPTPETFAEVTTPWTQTDWSGGSGQNKWFDDTKFLSSTGLDFATTGQLTLTSTELLTNTGFESATTGWTSSTQSLTLQPDATAGLDTFTVESSPDSLSSATSASLGTRPDSPNRRFPLIKFDLSSIPTDAPVQSATLSVWNAASTTANRTFAVNRILPANSTWTEAAATWNYAVNATTRWAGDTGADGSTDAGASVSGTDYSATDLGTFTYTANSAADTQLSSSLDTTEFQNMLAANHGLIIRRTEGSGSLFNLRSSDHTSATERPKLVVQYGIDTRSTETTHASSVGAVKLQPGTNGDASYTQAVNVGDTSTYTLSTYAYTDGSEVTSSDVELHYNGTAISTNYASAGSGWYLLSADVTGANASRTFGVTVKSGKTVYADDFSLKKTSASGSLTSSVIDVGGTPQWGTLTYTADTPANTNVTVRVRSGYNEDMTGSNDFDDCLDVPSGTDLTISSCVSDTERYLQYMITADSSQSSVTPTFYDISASFDVDLTPSPSPETSPEPTPEPTPDPTPTPSPETSPEPTPSPSPEASPETSPSPSPTATPNSTATPSPSPSPSPTGACTATPPSGTPLLFAASALTATSIQAQYTTVGANVTGYTVEYGPQSGQYLYSTTVGASQTSVIIGALQAQTTYYFHVRAVNDCTAGSWSNELSAGGGVSALDAYLADEPVATSTVTDLTTGVLKKPGIGVNSESGSDATNGETNSNGSDTGSQSANQSEVGLVVITVVDKNGTPVAGADVTLYSTPRYAKTDSYGEARFNDVAVGEHTVVISYQGYTATQKIFVAPVEASKGNLGDQNAATNAATQLSFTVQIEPRNELTDSQVQGALIIGASVLIVLIVAIRLRRRSGNANQFS